jgi:hypothetical protein
MTNKASANTADNNNHLLIRKKPIRKALRVLLWVLAFSALMALLAVMFGQWLPEGGVLQLGDETIILGEGASLGASAGFVAWAAVTVGLFIAFFAVVFALLVTALVLLVTAVMGVFTVLALLSPALVIGLLVYWAIRSYKRSRSHNAAPAMTAPRAA